MGSDFPPVTFRPDGPAGGGGDAAVVVGVWAGPAASVAAALKVADAELGLAGALEALLDDPAFAPADGKVGSSGKAFCRVHGTPPGAPRYVGLVGLGPAEAPAAGGAKPQGRSAWHALGEAVAAASKGKDAPLRGAKTVGVAVCGGTRPAEGGPAASAALDLAKGVLLGKYESTRFKSQPEGEGAGGGAQEGPEAIELLGLFPAAAQGEVDAALVQARGVASGVTLARYLVEAPPNVCTPAHLADAARSCAELHPETMSLKVLGRAECEALGMGCYLGVAECSALEPQFIHLTYRPAGEVKKRVALVGKGLTFDSGGYNLKVAGSMIEMMKFDMGGSAATLGAARIVGDLAPAGVECHFIVAACENMIDGKGMRPGDILTASNGMTVEINNTDAEGRLTLCDALVYAQDQVGAEAIVDSATLTGACMVALGNDMAGLFSPSDAMADGLREAAEQAGEKLWRLPLEDAYMEQLKSSVADLKNTGTRYGGSITAALYLKEFIDTKNVEWAHVDMAGPVWDDKQGGATGFGAATLARWVQHQGQ